MATSFHGFLQLLSVPPGNMLPLVLLTTCSRNWSPTSLTWVNGAKLHLLVWYKPLVLNTKLTHCCVVISDFTEELEAINGIETPCKNYYKLLIITQTC